MAEEGREAKRLIELEKGMALWRISVDDLHEQAKNARAMDDGTFNRLTENVRKEGRLESLPFCALTTDKDKERFEVVSGHHRLRAARAAGMEQIHVLVDETGLNRSAIAAKQLAHNAIQGVDDPDMLAQIYSEIEDAERQIETHLDPSVLGLEELADAAKLTALTVDFDAKVVNMVFLPSQVDHMEKVVERINPQSTTVYALPMELYERFKEVTERVGGHEDIRQLGAVLSRVFELAEERLNELEKGSTLESDPF